MKNVFRSLRELITRHSRINWALMDQGMVSGANFLTGVLLARYLGIKEFGVFSLVWMVVLFVNTIQEALITSPMMSLGPKKSDEESGYYFGAVAIKQLALAVVSFILILLGVLATASFNPGWNIQPLALPLALSSFTNQIQDFLRRYFYTSNKQSSAFIIDFVRYGAQIALLVGAVFIDAITSANTLWIIAVAASLAIIIGIKQTNNIRLPTTSYFVSTLPRHWDFSKWLMASALMQWIKAQFFTIIAAAYLGPAAAGAMRACQIVMGVLNILFFSLSNVAPPHAAKVMHNSGIEPMLGYLRKLTYIGGGVTALYVILGAAMPEFWLRVIFGEGYAGYGFVLQWYAAIYFVSFFSIIFRTGLCALEYTKPLFWANAFGAVFTLVFSIPMISYFGLLGAMVGLFCANVISRLIQMITFTRRMREEF